jgi:hypothetical protein
VCLSGYLEDRQEGAWDIGYAPRAVGGLFPGATNASGTPDSSDKGIRHLYDEQISWMMIQMGNMD